MKGQTLSYTLNNMNCTQTLVKVTEIELSWPKKSNRNRVCMIKHNTSEVCVHEREICKAYKKIKINQNFQIIQNILVRRKCAFNVEGDISGFLLEGPNLRRLHSRNFKSVLKILNGDLLLGSFNYLSISTSMFF